MKLLSGGMTYLQAHGVRWTCKRLREKLCEQVFGVLDHSPLVSVSAEELEKQKRSQPDGGLISIVIPVYNTKPEWLQELAESILAQTYRNWEACFYDGASTQEDTCRVLKALQQRDRRLRVEFGGVNAGISGNTNAAIGMAQGSYLAFCDHDDVLAPDALWRVAERIASDNPDVIYSDEDRLNGRHHTDLHLKPDYCPDNLLSANYICHLTVIRRSLVLSVGGLRPAFDGSQDHDLVLRCAAVGARFSHIPHVLYHWRNAGGSMSHQRLAQCRSASARAVEEHMRQTGYPGTAEPLGDVLRLRYELTGQQTIDAIVVANLQTQAEACTEQLRHSTVSSLQCQVMLRENDNDSYGNLIDRAVRSSHAEYLLLWDASMIPDTQMIAEMLMLAQRSFTGCVFPMVTDSKGRIVHAGYALMADGTVTSRNTGLLQVAGGRNMLELQNHNVAAGSYRCCMLRRSSYQPINDDGDAEWCMRIPGYHVVAVHAHAWSEWELRTDEKLKLPVHDPCISPYYAQNHQADFCIRREKLYAVD